MPEVHVTKLDAVKGKSALKLALEVAMLGVGVFLGLAGEQWREHRSHHESAQAALRRFRTEVANNRNAIAAVKDYHVTMRERIDKYLAATGQERESLRVHLQGIRPAFPERTAWELALATQSLVYIDEHLAFALSRAYSTQQQYNELTRDLLQAMYVRPPSENETVFLGAVAIYYGDIVLLEPKLIELYDSVGAEIDRALGIPRNGQQ